MKNNPQVAIMMPVFNAEKSLMIATKSLQNQTYTNWRCYVVNDGSQDRTKEILDSIIDKRFIIVHLEKNMGRPFARQTALNIAEGKYMAMLDADDFYHPKKIEKQVNFMEANPDVSLFSFGLGAYRSLENGLIRVRGTNVKNRLYNMGGKHFFIHNSSILILKDAKKIKFDLSMKRGQDMDFLRRYLNGKIYTTSDLPYYYISEFESITKKKIIYTHFLDLKKYFFTKMVITNKIKNVTLIAFKILFTSILSPFFSIDFFLNRRGRLATELERNEFNTCVCNLKNSI